MGKPLVLKLKLTFWLTLVFFSKSILKKLVFVTFLIFLKCLQWLVWDDIVSCQICIGFVCPFSMSLLKNWIVTINASLQIIHWNKLVWIYLLFSDFWINFDSKILAEARVRHLRVDSKMTNTVLYTVFVSEKVAKQNFNTLFRN